MMKWGRKKPSSSSSTSSSSSIFAMSWFTKLMQKDSNLDHKPAKTSPQPKSAIQSTPEPVSCLKNGRFHSPGGDAYSSTPSMEDLLGADKTTGNSLSVLDTPKSLPSPTCPDCNRDIGKFNGIRKLKQLPQSKEVSPEVVKDITVEGGRGREELIVPGRKAVKDQNMRKICRRVLEEKMQELARIPEETPEEKDIFEARVPDTRKNSDPYCFNSMNGNSQFQDLNLKERFELSEEKVTSEWKQLKDMKIREVLSKGEKQRKSVYVSREQQRRPKQSCRVKAYSPRTAARIECKIKALEDMKKARMMRTKRVDKSTLFDSYAVAKSSFDPERDFRSSMIEMITEKGIERPEELEELLACYLTLNVDEYHELIIKVFRQVWFELNKECFGLEKQM